MNWLDKIFLNVIYNYPEKGPYLFMMLFRKANTSSLIRFLSDDASKLDLINILLSMPKILMLKGFFKKMITKTNKHQIFFIILSLIVLFGCLGSDGLFLDLIGFGIPINLFDETHSKNIIFWSLCLIGTLGVSHGAFDGKIIWKHSNKNSPRFKLYTLYILLTLLGAILWFYFPILGLGLLLFLSCIHFGLSDLSFIKGRKHSTYD